MLFRRFILLALGSLLGTLVHAQVPVVLLTDAQDLASSVAELPAIREGGMRVSVIAAPGAFIGTITGDPDRIRSAFRSIGDLRTTWNDPDRTTLTAGQRLALDYLQALQDGRFDGPRIRRPMDWSGYAADQLIREEDQHGAGPAGDRDANDAPDWTCTSSYNSEYMEGTVCVSAFFVESDGSVDPNLYTWPAAVITNVELQLVDAWSIWSYTAALHGVTVTAVMDFHEPAGGIPVQGYEPITRPSSQDNLWIGAIMQNAGSPGGDHFAQCDAFNSARRTTLGTDHAYCTFIAYNPPAQAAPNQFTDGRIGYAYLGGPYTQILYKANGWGTDQVNRVFGHETGHIFHAFDEYSSSGTSNCTKLFNGRQNSNFHGSTCNGTADCVMVNNTFTGSGAERHWDLCSHTPYHLGWQGRLIPATPISPLNDPVLTAQPVKLKWNRNGAPAGVVGYVKVFDRGSGALVQCAYVGQADSLLLNLVNGQYDWQVGIGNANDGNGYAGVISPLAQFTVNTPLQASFTRAPAVVCAGTTVSFTNTSTGAPISWSWSFPGGIPGAFEGTTPPAILYPAPGYYAVSLTVSDGVTSHTSTMSNAVTVTGGAAIPFAQDFNGGSFPPSGWTTVGDNGQGPPLGWTADAVQSCAAGISPFVNAYSFTGSFSGPQLGTPRFDLTQATMPYLSFRYSYARESAANTETLQVYGHDCAYGVYSTFFNRTGQDLATNGGAFVMGQPWIPMTCADWRDVIVRLDALSGRIGRIWFYLFTSGGQNLFLDDVRIFNGVRLPLRVLLRGPWDAGSGMMGDALRAQGLLPVQEPYTAVGYSFLDDGAGHTLIPAVLATTGPDAIVDWMILEIRDPADPTRILCSRPVLVQRDGDVVDADGLLPPRLSVPAGSYYVCLKHRNHLGVMTASAVSISNGMAALDLSDPLTPAWGTSARFISSGRAFLWTGNTTGDGVIRYTGSGNDRDPILLTVGSTTPNNSVPGYRKEDCTLDGQVRYTGAGNDRDPILQSVGSTTPNYSRVQQVP